MPGDLTEDIHRFIYKVLLDADHLWGFARRLTIVQ